jgi:hypothetical protein
MLAGSRTNVTSDRPGSPRAETNRVSPIANASLRAPRSSSNPIEIAFGIVSPDCCPCRRLACVVGPALWGRRRAFARHPALPEFVTGFLGLIGSLRRSVQVDVQKFQNPGRVCKVYGEMSTAGESHLAPGARDAGDISPVPGTPPLTVACSLRPNCAYLTWDCLPVLATW